MKRIVERKVWVSGEYEKAQEAINTLDNFIEKMVGRGELTSRQAMAYTETLTDLAGIIDIVGAKSDSFVPQMRRR